jgi:SAM-dependent methyltransferase
MEHDARQHHQHHGDDDFEASAELLDLDAEVLHDYLSGAIGWVYETAADRPVRRILDLGCGTGSGTMLLAQRFAGADVVAVDQSAEMLGRVRARARDLGLADRVQTVEANLDEAWPATGALDLTWMSKALHHLADPSRGLAQIFAALRPGGLLAVAEPTASLRFLPDDIGLGRPGLESRSDAALRELLAPELPYLGADFGPIISAAGFTDVAARTFDIDLSPPLPAAAARYAWQSLRRTRARLDGVIDGDDLATLDEITAENGPHSLLRREDLAIRGTRTLWTATRP